MFHESAVVQAPHGKSFKVNGTVEQSHAGELLSEEEFSRLAATDVRLTRSTGGGFSYEVEFAVVNPAPKEEDVSAS